MGEFVFAGRGSGGGDAATTQTARDAVAALRALGFNEETSAKMVADALAKGPEVDSVEQIIKLALAGKR